MLQGYIEDVALHKNPSTFLVLETAVDQGSGYFNGDIKNFFSAPVSKIDTRANRLTIFSNPLYGSMKLWFDNEHIMTDENANDLDDEQWQQIFNIVEYCTYTTNTVEDIETYMLANSDIFGTYRPATLSTSTGTSDVICRLNNNTTVDATPIRRFISFEFMNDADIVSIRLWINTPLFKAEYPLYKITNIIFPCSPTHFLTSVSVTNFVQTIINTVDYTMPLIDTEVTTEDHSGIYIYRTTYINGNLSGQYQIPFTIFYKGHQPSTLSIRAAIRAKLEATVGIDPTIWPDVFPELYTENRMYIIPIWNNVTPQLEFDIYPSITRYNVLLDIIQTVFTGLQPDFISTNMCLFTCDSSSMLLMAIPDPSNTPLVTLRDTHPTFVNVDATSLLFARQTIETRDFNIKICNAISTLLGSTSTTTSFTTIEEDGRQYISFISGLIEYCVLYRTSFPF